MIPCPEDRYMDHNGGLKRNETGNIHWHMACGCDEEVLQHQLKGLLQEISGHTQMINRLPGMSE